MPSPDDIANDALDMIGETITDNLLDETANGRKKKRGYDKALRAMLGGSYAWRFAKERIYLAALAEAPLSAMWSYQYELPSDCVKPRRIQEDDRAEWAREGDKLLANSAGPLLLEYTKLVTDPGLWPGAFDVALTRLAASFYAGSFKHDSDKAKEMYQFYITTDLPEAKTGDAQQASISAIRVPTLTTDVRVF
jgi:hypothetical protein